MRRIIALNMIALVAATPLAAQFEGTVTMRLTTAGGANGGDMNMKIAVKGDRSATTMSMPSSAGPMAGMEVRSVYDPKANTMTMLMPMMAGMASIPGMQNAKGMKTVVDMSKAQSMGNRGGAEPKTDVKKLGTSQTILGMSCDDYEITSGNNNTTRVCVTAALGRFALPQMGGGMGGRGAQSPSWTRAFGNRPMFPLKAWNADGQVALEVTAIDKGTVPASMFEVPDGYVDMAAMMGGMGRPPR